MTYPIDTDKVVAAVAFANTPRSLLHALLRQEVVTSLASSRLPDELALLAREAATGTTVTIEDTAVAYSAIAAFALKDYSSTVASALDRLRSLPLTWADDLVREVHAYAVPTKRQNLTPEEFITSDLVFTSRSSSR
jgi:hypothetical protein